MRGFPADGITRSTFDFLKEIGCVPCMGKRHAAEKEERQNIFDDSVQQQTVSDKLPGRILFSVFFVNVSPVGASLCAALLIYNTMN